MLLSVHCRLPHIPLSGLQAALAKCALELDRTEAMREAGFLVALSRLLQPQLTAKSDLLIGAPRYGVLPRDSTVELRAAMAQPFARQFHWPWR